VGTSATLLVTPDQAEAIALAAERGALRLVLRGPDDHALRKAKPLTAKASTAERSDFPGGRPAAAAPAPAPAAPIFRETPPAAPAPRLDAPAPRLAPPNAEPGGGVEIIRGLESEVVRP
jgi:hypothetical protein